MKSMNGAFGYKTSFLAAILTFTWLGLVSGNALAGEAKKDSRKFTKASDYTSAKDWKLQAENLVSTGANSLYGPLKPGFKYIMERPDHPDGRYRKEVMVLDTTEPFDIPGVGKFEARVVQEEEFLDGRYTQQVLNWVAIDKTNNNVYTFGEASWEIDKNGSKVFQGTWRAGVADGKEVAQAGLVMPGGPFKVGYRYIFDGSKGEAFGGAENMQAGVAMTTPAGKFENCVRVREQGLTDIKDVTEKVWCPEVGLVSDSSEGKLVASDALPGTDLTSFGKYHKAQRAATKQPTTKITKEQASQIALKVIPGEVKDVVIETKLGKTVYVVEIAKKDGKENDVFVEVETGKVIGTD